MKKSVVVLQANEMDASEIAMNLSDDFNVVGYSGDCEKVISFVRSNRPDFLITSLFLKKADGMDVIERVKKLVPEIIVVVVTAVANFERIRSAVNFEFDYCMVKPINYDILISRMNSISNSFDKRQNKEDLNNQVVSEKPQPQLKVVKKAETANQNKDGSRAIDERISRIFIGIGIPPHIKGYSYLREGIKLAVGSPEIINSVTKKLYPTIGDHFGTSASKVERAIRHAIEVAWNKGRIESFNSLFGVRAYGENEKPTNSEFIALIADRLLLDGISC